MADLGTAGFTVISPDEAAKLIAAKKPASGVKTISASEAGRLMASKKSAAIPDASKMTQAQAVQQFEGGGLQAPAVDPIDVGVFAATGGAYGLGKEGISAGAKLAADEAASVAGGEGFQKSMEPIIQQIPGKGAAGNIARGAASIVTGAAPFIVAGGMGPTARGSLEKVAGGKGIAQAGVEAGTKAGEATEAAQKAIGESKAAAGAELDKNYEKFRQSQIPEAKSAAREETIKNTVGQAPPSTMEQGPERIARNEQFRESTTAPLERWRSDWADRRNKLLESRKDTVVDDGPLQTAVTADEAKWQQGARPYSPAAQRLIDKVKGLGTEPGPLSDLFTDEEWAKMTPTQRANYLKSAGRTESPAKMTSYKEGAAPPVNAAGQTRTRPKVPELIGLQSEANSLARSSKGADRTLALKVVHGIDDSLAGADIDVPAYKKIQAEYRDHRLHFPYAFEDAIQGTARPVDTAKQIFAEPERALDLANLSNESEKQNLRQLYGQYVDENGPKAATQEQAPFLAKLYPNSPLAKPEAWVYEDKALTKLSDVFANAPAAKQKFMASLEQERTRLLDDTSKSIVTDALKETDGLGNTGARIKAKILAGKTPAEQAKIAMQEFGALSPAEEAQQAGTQAIQNYKPAQHGTFMSRVKGRAEIYTVLAVAMPGTMLKRAAILGTVAGADAALRKGLMWSLSKPADAAAFYRAAINPGMKGSLDTLARSVIMSALPAETAQVGQAATAKPSTSAGPMVKQVEHEKAVNIAGPRGAVSPARTSRIEDLNKDIAQGKEPEVHADLRNGRLTHTDLAKMVQPDKPGVAGLFQGMSPTQAVDAFAVADQSEREMAMPALAQHLQDSAKTTDPKQMAIAMQKLKSIMAQQGATA